MPTTWDSGHAGTAVVLSGGSLTAKVPTGTNQAYGVLSTTSFSTGKKYAEAKFVSYSASSGEQWLFGLANSTITLNNFNIGQGTAGVGYEPNRSNNTRALYYNSGFVGATPLSPGGSVGDVLAIAVDFGAGLAWWKDLTASLGWDPSGDPNTGTGGLDITTAVPITKPLFLAWSGTGASLDDIITLNPGPGGFTGTVPTGFSSWDASTTLTVVTSAQSLSCEVLARVGESVDPSVMNWWRPPAANIIVTPTAPIIPNTTPLGAIVATIDVSVSDGSPVQNSLQLGFGPPYFSDGGTFSLVKLGPLNPFTTRFLLIVNPGGPGVGPDGSTVQRVNVITA